MTRHDAIIAMLVCFAPLLFAEEAKTNALIEVKQYKNWILEKECGFISLAIKNTGTAPILLAKTPNDFEMGQLRFAKDRKLCDELYLEICRYGDGFFKLLPAETHVYENRDFLLGPPHFVSDGKMFATASVYLGDGVWLDSEPLSLNVVAPDSEEEVGIINNKKRNVDYIYTLVAITYKKERWLCTKVVRSGNYYTVCPVSLANTIRVEPYDDEALFKIWDGDKTMIFDLNKGVLLEGVDENNVLGAWTRERKQRAEAENAEVRRKKIEEQK